MKTSTAAALASFAMTLAACGGYDLDEEAGSFGGEAGMFEDAGEDADDDGSDAGAGDEGGDAGQDGGSDPGDFAAEGDGGGEGGGDDGSIGYDGGDDEGDDDEDLSCGPFETVLVAAQQYEAGRVWVDAKSGRLNVTVQTFHPWMLDLVHLSASVEPLQGGDNAPGDYPFHYELDQEDHGYFQLSLAELGAECGDVVDIAFHAEVSEVVDGHVVKSETAWAEGEIDFDDAWGSHFFFKVCCPAA